MSNNKTIYTGSPTERVDDSGMPGGQGGPLGNYRNAADETVEEQENEMADQVGDMTEGLGDQLFEELEGQVDTQLDEVKILLYKTINEVLTDPMDDGDMSLMDHVLLALLICCIIFGTLTCLHLTNHILICCCELPDLRKAMREENLQSAEGKSHA